MPYKRGKGSKKSSADKYFDGLAKRQKEQEDKKNNPGNYNYSNPYKEK